MQKVLFLSVVFGVLALTSCSHQGELATVPAQNLQEIKMEDYLDLPKSMAGSKKVLLEEGYRVKSVSDRKFVATKKFSPAVIFYNEEGARMATRKHEITVFKPKGYEGEGSVKIGKYTP